MLIGICVRAPAGFLILGREGALRAFSSSRKAGGETVGPTVYGETRQVVS